MIDWVVAEWVAGQIVNRTAGGGEINGLGAIELQPLVDEAKQRVVEYTGLVPVGPIPVPEAIDRHEWVRANIVSTRAMLDPLLDSAASKLGPAKGTGRLWLGLTSSTEIGILIGFMGQRVMGQYELILLDERSDGQAPRLLFVLPNLQDAVRRLNADETEFLTWVVLHEVTHAVQFGGVPWLREYLASLIRELLASAEERMDVRRHLRLPSRAQLARAGKAALHADVVGIVATERERDIIDRAQAVMAVIEGHAEHVMDAVAGELVPSLLDLRRSLDHRRKQQSGLSKYLGKLLGFEMKLRQYQQGKIFCDAIVAEAGPGALTAVFSSQEALPTLDEIKDPVAWLQRSRSHV
jgi:coenzyme F420 biosynthesis associated uncharacterized protein